MAVPPDEPSDDPDAVVRAVLQRVIGDVIVTGMTRLTGGASRETWRCDTTGGVFVVQRQRADADRDMGTEAAIVRAAAAAGVPVPEVMGHLPDVDGTATLVTRHVAGETIARRILRDDEFGVARETLTAQLATALARVHRIDPTSVPGLEPVDPLAVYRDRFDAIGQPHPTFELALRWLDANRPPTSSVQTVVHGDYRLGNVIVGAEGLAAVIDWELAHIGDPIEDLGWLCVPAWRFGSRLPAAGVGTRQQLLDAYRREAQVAVDDDALRWWEVCGILRWGIMCMNQAETHRSGLVRSHELAAIGRRVCETEHDLFLALEGRW
jgi:aminoglycoside phosphotransferase (APT) family kinase protein